MMCVKCLSGIWVVEDIGLRIPFSCHGLNEICYKGAAYGEFSAGLGIRLGQVF